MLRQARIDRANAVQEVGVAAESVRVLHDHVLPSLALLVLVLPFLGVICALRRLQLVQQHLILIDDLGETANSICAVQRRIRVQSICWLLNLAAL